MSIEEEIIEQEKQIERWSGINKYLVKGAQVKLQELKEQLPNSKLEEKVEPVKKVSKPKKPKVKKLTEKELFKLNKAEQVKLLKKLGSGLIPRLEKGRVKLILKLQGGK